MKNFLRVKRMITLETHEKNISIRHRAQQHITRSYSSKHRCKELRRRRSASLPCTSYANSHKKLILIFSLAVSSQYEKPSQHNQNSTMHVTLFPPVLLCVPNCFHGHRFVVSHASCKEEFGPNPRSPSCSYIIL